MPPKKATSTGKVTKAAPKTAAAKKSTTAKKVVAPPTVAKAPAAESRKPRKGKVAEEVEDVEEDVEDEEDEEEAEEEAPAPKKSSAAAKKAAIATAPAKKTAAPKKAPASKAASTKKAAVEKKSADAPIPSEGSDKENHGAAPAQAKTNGKRKRTETPKPEEDDEVTEKPATKKAKTGTAKTDSSELAAAQAVTTKAATTKKPRAIAAPKRSRMTKKIINDVPTEVLQAFVFGEGTSGELGLGAVKVDGKKPIDVKRPRLNPNLKNIVQIACGGMHVVALTNENKILTWGVNDQGALGRDTTWEGGLRDMDDEENDSDDEDDTGMNPNESTPGEIDTTEIEPDAKFVQVVASDSASFALTEEGQVYGWGTFRNNEGILGFTQNGPVTQKTPILLPNLNKISQLAAGSNHVLALDSKTRRVLAWGSGQQCQLARKLVERDNHSSLVPQSIGNIHRGVVPTTLACGSYHSFVIDQEGKVWAWGLNNYAELGLEFDAGEDGGTVLKPTLVESLSQYKITSIAGGEHHSLACTDDGKLLTWGRIDGHQVGLPASAFNEENAIFDEHKKPRILMQPTVVEGIPPVALVAAGTDHSIAITRDGKAYSWGFSANYQTGQGTDDDIETPTLIDNTAVRGKKLVWAGAGGQYSIVAAPEEEAN